MLAWGAVSGVEGLLLELISLSLSLSLSLSFLPALRSVQRPSFISFIFFTLRYNETSFSVGTYPAGCRPKVFAFTYNLSRETRRTLLHVTITLSVPCYTCCNILNGRFLTVRWIDYSFFCCSHHMDSSNSSVKEAELKGSGHRVSRLRGLRGASKLPVRRPFSIVIMRGQSFRWNKREIFTVNIL